MSYTGLVERLGDEADLCRNEGADDIAALLDDARAAIEALTRPVDVEAIVDAALDAANLVTLDGYFEYDREAALAAALAAMEASHADG